MRRLTINVTPLLVLDVVAPCAFLNANQRPPHWAVTHKRTRAWRHAGRDAALAHAGTYRPAPLPTPVRIVVTIHRPHRGRWDPTNYAPTAKALVDGLVDAGVLVDDDVTRVTGPDCRPGKPDRLETTWGHHPGARVHIYPHTEDTP